jgi:toxin CcdB
VRQFDLYENPVASMRQGVPFVMVLSSHLLADLAEVVVAPVLSRRAIKLMDFEIPLEWNDRSLLISISGMAAVRRANLRRKITSLAAYEDDIRRAVDRLFTGF